MTKVMSCFSLYILRANSISNSAKFGIFLKATVVFHNLLFSFLLSVPFYLLALYQCLTDTVTSIQVHFPKF